MDTFLPWASIAIAAAVLILSARPRPGGATTPGSAGGPTQFWLDMAAAKTPLLGTLAIGALALAAGYIWESQLPGLSSVGTGIAIGALMAACAHVLELALSSSSSTLLPTLAIAAGFVGAALLGKGSVQVLLGLVFGAASGAGVLSLSGGRGTWARNTTFLAGILAGATALGLLRGDEARYMQTPIVFACAALFAALLTHAAVEFIRKQSGDRGVSPLLGAGIAVILLIAAAKVIAARYLFLNAAFICMAGAILSAALAAWIISDDREDDPGSFAIASIIWVSWVIVAFGLLQGFGVAISAAAAATLLVAIDSRRALTSLGIVLAIVFYRIFLELYPAESRAIDIGQQYAVIGLLIGAALPLATAGWAAKVRANYSGLGAVSLSFIAGVVLLLAVCGLSFVIGSRGAVGFVVGLGVAIFAQGIAGKFRLAVPAIVCGLGSAMLLSFNYISPHIGLERETKIRVLAWALGALVVVLILAEMLSRRPSKLKESESVV